jgi:Ca2+-transporting ATPase
MGRIGETMRGLDPAIPRLRKEIRRIVSIFAVVGSLVTILVVVLYGTLRGSWLDAALGGLALGISMLPEEFPLVLTVFMAMGAWRISRARVLTRRAAAIESLGSATVLCTDKTGTLTENRMSVAEIRLASGPVLRVEHTTTELPGEFHDIASFGMLACAAVPFDPMEKAFHAFAAERLPSSVSGELTTGRIVRTYGLRPDLLAMSQVWSREIESRCYTIAAKGAPEAMAKLCQLDAQELSGLSGAVEEMAAKGLRVLGIARAQIEGDRLPESQRDFHFEFLGLVGLADPLRRSVPQAIQECRAAGIRIVMITGDYPATALSIAEQAGIGAGQVLTGIELDKITDSALMNKVRTVNVFARILPHQKLRIVNSLKTAGEVVAMTGDGVNDAPSLKAAHIGIAMGGRGTDVAREASSIVLLDDDFSSIVKTIRLGRRIYDNLRKATGFIFSVHFPIAGMALFPLVSGMPVLLGPIHIAFLEMVVDPVCSLAFEAEREEKDVMQRPPRSSGQPLFSHELVVSSILQGAMATLLVIGIFLVALEYELSTDQIRTLVFISLVQAIVGLIFVHRVFNYAILGGFRHTNRTLGYVVVAVLFALAVIFLLPEARELFQFDLLEAREVAIMFGLGLAILFAQSVWRFMGAHVVRLFQ